MASGQELAGPQEQAGLPGRANVAPKDNLETTWPLLKIIFLFLKGLFQKMWPKYNEFLFCFLEGRVALGPHRPPLPLGKS